MCINLARYIKYRQADLQSRFQFRLLCNQLNIVLRYSILWYQKIKGMKTKTNLPIMFQLFFREKNLFECANLFLQKFCTIWTGFMGVNINMNVKYELAVCVLASCELANVRIAFMWINLDSDSSITSNSARKVNFMNCKCITKLFWSSKCRCFVFKMSSELEISINLCNGQQLLIRCTSSIKKHQQLQNKNTWLVYSCSITVPSPRIKI